MALDYLKQWIYAVMGLGFLVTALVIATTSLQDDVVTDLTTSATTNETLTLDNATAVGLGENYVAAVSSVYVIGGGGNNRTLATTEYSVANLGTQVRATITLSNNSFDGNTSYVNYTFYPEQNSTAANISGYALAGSQNATSYFGNAGTLFGVALIVASVMVMLWMSGIVRKGDGL